MGISASNSNAGRRRASGVLKVLSWAMSAVLAMSIGASAIAADGAGRPLTIVALVPAPAGTAAQETRATLEKAASARALSISVVPLQVTDSTGVELSRDIVLQTARRMGGGAVLVGRGDSAALHGQWEWTLHTPLASESWTGSLEAGVNGAADALARAQSAVSTLPASDTVMEVSGVATLADYASLTRLLESVPGVQQVSIAEAGAGTAVFHVLVRGGGDAIDRAVSNSGRLTRAGASGGRLVYQYRP